MVSQGLGFNQITYFVIALIAALCTSYIRGIALDLMERCLTNKSLKKVSLNLKDYLEPFGLLAYVFLSLGWHKITAYENIRLNKPKQQILLHLAPFLASLSVASLLEILKILSLNYLAQDYLALTDFLIRLMSMSQLMLISSSILHILPLPPCPGFKLVYFYLNTKQRFKLNHWYSTLMFIMALLVFLGANLIHIPAMLILSNLSLKIAILLFILPLLILAIYFNQAGKRIRPI